MKKILLALLIFTSLTLFSEDLDNEFMDDDFGSEFEEEFETQAKVDFDPLSGYNRVMTVFNDSLFTYAVFPVAKVYVYIMPAIVIESVDDFFENLKYPVRLANNLLQLKFVNSLEESGRFVLNSTIGLAGFFDPAEAWFDMKGHNEDFGQTLGHYGVGSGFHIVLPFFGPSNLRDAAALVVDWQIDPFFYQEGRSYNILTNSFWESIGLKSFEYFNKHSGNIEQYEMLKKDAIDLYPLIKDIYEQKREQEIAE